MKAKTKGKRTIWLPVPFQKVAQYTYPFYSISLRKGFSFTGYLPVFEMVINVWDIQILYDAVQGDPLNFKVVKQTPKFIERFVIQNGISVKKLILKT